MRMHGGVEARHMLLGDGLCFDLEGHSVASVRGVNLDVGSIWTVQLNLRHKWHVLMSFTRVQEED